MEEVGISWLVLDYSIYMLYKIQYFLEERLYQMNPLAIV